jgi:ABC-2 type transport system ATP-binding protein
MSITVSNLTKQYGSQLAINNISFNVAKGEIVGFLGPNGAGKSSTMKILAGFSNATLGEARLNDDLISVRSTDVKRKIGYLPEHNPLYLDMYVTEFLAFTGRLCGIPKSNLYASVEQAISLVDLESEQHKKIDQLSKGFRQRVGLAQALIHDPEVLILDEPTTGLDPNQLVEIRNLIKQIGRQKTILLSTHIMQEVEAICSRVIILHKGHIVADDMLDNLVGQANSLESVFRKLTSQ